SKPPPPTPHKGRQQKISTQRSENKNLTKKQSKKRIDWQKNNQKIIPCTSQKMRHKKIHHTLSSSQRTHTHQHHPTTKMERTSVNIMFRSPFRGNFSRVTLERGGWQSAVVGALRPWLAASPD
ncbi:hypothetical protein, partial [Gordonia sp. VNK21]|uniref:hypothetical protein n=1 Tax=Gordonia sp. VNK21 TaxID=3382483 RepID=UPI0038D4BC57